MFEPHVAYAMNAPDGTVVYRVPQRRAGWWAVRYKNRWCAVLGGIRGPLWISAAWTRA